jgi:hypothetical protein
MFLAQAFNIVRETLERDRDTRPHGAALEALLEIEDAFRALLQENDRLRLRPLFGEAADEIEPLREEVATLRATYEPSN